MDIVVKRNRSTVQICPQIMQACGNVPVQMVAKTNLFHPAELETSSIRTPGAVERRPLALHYQEHGAEYDRWNPTGRSDVPIDCAHCFSMTRTAKARRSGGGATLNA
jgi:hypothetical protein